MFSALFVSEEMGIPTNLLVFGSADWRVVSVQVTEGTESTMAKPWVSFMVTLLFVVASPAEAQRNRPTPCSNKSSNSNSNTRTRLACSSNASPLWNAKLRNKSKPAQKRARYDLGGRVGY